MHRLISPCRRLLRGGVYADFPEPLMASVKHASAQLLDELPFSYHLQHDVSLTEVGLMDHVVIGPTGVFCIASSDWQGSVGLGPYGELLHNGANVEAVVTMQLRWVMRFREILGEVLLNQLFITAAMVIRPDVLPRPRPHHRKIELWDANHMTHFLLREPKRGNMPNGRALRAIKRKIRQLPVMNDQG